jgi:hypothetical protein
MRKAGRQFAEQLKSQYAGLKLSDVGLFQKIVAYKQIAYVHVLQRKYLRKQDKWIVVRSMPITDKSDKEGRDAFMNLFRYPLDDSRWTATVDGLIVQGAMLHFEITESFDSSKINQGIFVAALVSLAVALAYGFAMDKDFSTGFSIASWLITAFGFIGALFTISEYAGQEPPPVEAD